VVRTSASGSHFPVTFGTSELLQTYIVCSRARPRRFTAVMAPVQARPLYVYIGDDDPRTPRWSAAGQRGGELLVDAQPARPRSWHAAHPLFQNIGDGPARLLALSHFWHGRFFEGVTLLPSDSFESAVLGYSIVGYAALLV